MAEETTRSGKSNISFLPGTKGYVMLAACRPSEYAYEYEFNGKEFNGALTYWLLDSLQSRSPDLTYKILYDRINAKVHSQFSSQTPMLFGEGNHLVFGSDNASLQYAVTVMQVDAAKNPVRLQLNAGQAQGLSEGAQLAIYPPGTTDFTQEEKQLAIAEIAEIGATDAWAEIVKTIRAGEIEQAAQAVLLSAPVEVVRRVRLVYQPERKQASKLNSVDAYINQGLTYHRQRNYQQAISSYSRAIALNPNSAKAYSNRAAAYNEQKDYPKAIADSSKAISLNPTYANAYINRGLAYYRQGNSQQAIANYNKVIELAPGNANAYHNRELAYTRLGNQQAAQADKRKAGALSQ